MTKLHQAFIPDGLIVESGLLLPSKRLPPDIEGSRKYITIRSSIIDVGLIEPLSVSAADPKNGTRVILDGHVRLDVLVKLGITKINCLEATDDEGYTYNRRVNRLSTVQEHHMLRRAVERGVSAERLAKALSVNPEILRRKVKLLDGIAPEAAELLKDRNFSVGLTGILRKMSPARQVACVDLMLSANMLTISYARGLLYTSPSGDLVEVPKKPSRKGVSAEMLARMQQEASALQDKYKAIEQDYGENMLNLTVVCAYVSRLLANSAVSKHLKKHHADAFSQLSIVIDATSMQG